MVSKGLWRVENEVAACLQRSTTLVVTVEVLPPARLYRRRAPLITDRAIARPVSPVLFVVDVAVELC